jgi:HK97 family phage major capsid protein
MPKDNLDLEAVVQAVDEVKSGFEQFKEAAKQREDELLKKGDVDPLIEEKLKKINDDLDEKQAVIDKLYAAGRRKSITLDGQSVTEEELDAKAYQWATLAAKRRDQRVEAFTHDDQLAYKAAQNAYLRKGDQLLTPDEAKALSVGSDPDGGYVVDPDTSGRIIKKIFETSPVRQYASVQVISTDALEGLRDLDETTFGWVGETSSRVETSTPQLEKWRIPVHEMYAEPRATQKLVDDMAIDLEGWLADKVADKFARAENTAFVNGTGVDQPRGFLTYPAGSTNPGQVLQKTTGANGAFAADPDGADALITMIHSLKSQYRANGVFAMNRTTLGAVRLLKDSQGRMLWQPSLAAGMPSTLLGYPLASFEDMPDYTTTDAQAIIFADFSEFYQVVDRLGIRTLRDPYTAKPYIKYYSTKRVGGDVANFEAAVTLKFGS